MADVAKLAGVSPQTVSRVSNGEPYVVEEKRRRVLQAMRELGYRPNSAARAMKRGAFRTIGVVFHSLHPVGTHRTLEAISEAAAVEGYATTLLPLEASTRRATDGAFTRLGEMAVDAVIAIISSHFTGDTALQLPTGVPTVVLGPPLVPGAASVDFDNAVGAEAAVTHLLGLGHRTVHHIAGPAESFSARTRRDVWRSVLEREGRPVPETASGDWSPDSGYRAMRELLARGEHPSALFVANDQMALGAFRAMLEAGLRIPEDVSVVGFDDIDEAVAFPTPLTTVSQDWDELGCDALRVAVDMVEGREPSTVSIPTRLVVRDSAGPAPARP
jgi:DNA-binding LacI/PurR family transcriptional regulator